MAVDMQRQPSVGAKRRRRQQLHDSTSDRTLACWDMLLKVTVSDVATILAAPPAPAEQPLQERQSNTKWWWRALPHMHRALQIPHKLLRVNTTQAIVRRKEYVRSNGVHC